MQQFMLVYEEVRRQDAPGGQDWVVRRGGKPTSHTPTDSLDTYRGRRYKRIPATPGHKRRQRAPAGLAWPANFSEDPDRGQVSWAMEG